MKRILNTKGETYVLICVFILIIVMTFSVILTYASAITVVKVQKSNTEIVFDSFVANNSILIYNNIKQGKNAVNGVDTDTLLTAIKDFCTLEEKSEMYYSIDANGNEQYRMTVPQLGYIEDEKLELYLSFTMYVPIRFAGQTVATAQVPVKITSELTSKN